MLRSLGFLLGSLQQIRDKLCACIYQHTFLMYWTQVCSSCSLPIFFFRNKDVSYHLLLVSI